MRSTRIKNRGPQDKTHDGLNTGCERIIGVDFDNTLVSYDELFHEIALQQGLIPPTIAKSKKSIRDHLRGLPDGEVEWQKLQALAYGPRMRDAKLVDGVRAFFELCNRNRVKVYVVSHKTDFVSHDKTQTNLRMAALSWMEANKFFRPACDGLGLCPDAVFFGETRREKIDHIKKLCCTHFIDDLEETFSEESFPVNVKKILYAPHPPPIVRPKMKVVTNWQEINDYFFSETD